VVVLGMVVFVMVLEVCITVDQLHGKIFCTSPPMTTVKFVLPLVGALDGWNA